MTAPSERRPAIKLKRAYEPPSAEDGARVLVERLWPRGLTKADAAIDNWLKDVAPSTELRRWFGHDPARWDAFRARYRDELRARPEALDPLRELCANGPVTLVFAARDHERNSAVALRDVLVDEER